MQPSDTVGLLDEKIVEWQEACRELGRMHGLDVFRTAMQAVNKRWSGTVGPWELPMPTTRRPVPRAFLIEWASEIAKSRWRISKEWFDERKWPTTLVPHSSRIIEAQHTGHDAGVDSAVAFERLPKMMRLIGTVGLGSMAVMGMMFRPGKAA